MFASAFIALAALASSAQAALFVRDHAILVLHCIVSNPLACIGNFSSCKHLLGRWSTADHLMAG